MCGIFGVVIGASSKQGAEWVDKAVLDLLFLSESRGQEACGVALMCGESLKVVKSSMAAAEFVKYPPYRRVAGDWKKARGLGQPLAVIGQSRLVISGDAANPVNNQPVVCGDTVMVHNGLIVNESALAGKAPEPRDGGDVDTMILARFVENERGKGLSLAEAMTNAYRTLSGEASTATLGGGEDELVLATNTGSLYLYLDEEEGVAAFASEKYFVDAFLQSRKDLSVGGNRVRRVAPEQMIALDYKTLAVRAIDEKGLDAAGGSGVGDRPPRQEKRRVEDLVTLAALERARLRRCTRCILPETMPYIEFDEDGVCNYCKHARAIRTKDRDELLQALATVRRGDGAPDCLVAFSGGRDSCFGLHLLKTELGMNPMAYTYDWGMVTDLARRNQSRLCSKLGIEHIWVSANIRKKRRNIRLNLEAWMRSPSLGVIPLFMAGDKQFFYYANQAMKRSGIDLMVFCMNHFERTDFKVGFAGIAPEFARERGYTLNLKNKLSLALYYGTQFVTTPSYFNRSLLDTFTAYLSYYFVNQDYLYLFDYVEWDETQVNSLLIGEYQWETAEDSRSTWRIGDGSAAFYNYVYHTVVGFTEHDVLRSNQIRHGSIARDEALALVAEENLPRWKSIHEYASTVGVDYASLLMAAEKMSTFYARIWRETE